MYPTASFMLRSGFSSDSVMTCWVNVAEGFSRVAAASSCIETATFDWGWSVVVWAVETASSSCNDAANVCCGAVSMSMLRSAPRNGIRSLLMGA